MSDPETPRTVEPLAAGQRRVLRFIQRYQDEIGEPPSIRLVARRLEVHHSTVQEVLRAAFRKGWLNSPSPAGLTVRISG